MTEHRPAAPMLGQILIGSLTALGSLVTFHRQLGDAAALVNGQPQELTLQASQYAYYTVKGLRPSSLPLSLALTTLTGSAGLFVSTSSAQPDAQNSEWARKGDGTITVAAVPILVKTGFECKSTDVELGAAGAFADVGACAAACAAHAGGCRFFIFGTGDEKGGSCYKEDTTTSACPEGFETDTFDFYELGGSEVNVGVFGYSDAHLTLTATWGASTARLADGKPQSGTLEPGGQIAYVARVSGASSDLSLSLSMSYGDADLYVKTNSAPTASDYFWSGSNTGDDHVTIAHTDPRFCAACDYHVLVVSKGGGESAFSLLAASSQSEATLLSGVPTNGAVGQGQSSHFKLVLPAQPTDVQVILTQLSGDADVFVSTAARPNQGDATWKSTNLEGDIITIKHTDAALKACLESPSPTSSPDQPGMCALHLTVAARDGASSYSLLATARTVGAGLHIDQPDLIAGNMNFYPATFGPPLPADALTAKIVYARPGAACPPKNAPPDWSLSNAADLEGAIALVDRGSSCPFPGRYFANKVLAAQRAKAVAVIVANDDAHGLDQLVYMGAATGDKAAMVRVPSVFVSYASGEKLKRQLTNGLRATLAQPSDKLPMLIAGQPLSGAAASNEIVYYQLFTSPTVLQTITITVSARFGNPDLFVSASAQRPNAAAFTWASQSDGSETLVIAADDPNQSTNAVYYIGVMGGDGQSTAYSVTVATESSSVALQDNVPLPAQEVGKQKYKFYRFWVHPQDQYALTVAVTMTSGDVDLYVSFKSNPTADDHQFKAAGRNGCATVECGNTIRSGDAIHISQLPDNCGGRSPCLAYIGVYGAEASVFSALVTTASRTEESAVQLLDGTPSAGSIARAGDFKYYTYQVPPAATSVALSVQPVKQPGQASQPDPDLYVKWTGDANPTGQSFDYRSGDGEGELATLDFTQDFAPWNRLPACTDNGCPKGRALRIGVRAWNAGNEGLLFAISATATVALESDSTETDRTAAATTVTAAVGLQADVPAPLTLRAGEVKRFHLKVSSPAQTLVAALERPAGGGAIMRGRVSPASAKLALVRSGRECNSDDHELGAKGAFADARACAVACAARYDCRFFIFGTGSKAGACYHETTMSTTCAEGWEEDDFDFYELPWWVSSDAWSTSVALSTSSCAELPCDLDIELDGTASPEPGDYTLTVGPHAVPGEPSLPPLGGGGGGGGGGFWLWLTLLLLLGACGYAVAVKVYKRSPADDAAAVRAKLAAVASALSSMRSSARRGMTRVDRTPSESIVAPLSASNYVNMKYDMSVNGGPSASRAPGPEVC